MITRKPLIIFILLLIAIIIFQLQFSITPRKINSPYTADNPKQTQDTKEKPQNILDIQKQIEEQMRKEQEIKAEQERLARLQNPEYILSALSKVGNLRIDVFEGNHTYTSTINQNGTIIKKGLEVYLKYHFIIGADLNLSTWEVASIEGDVVTLNIPYIKPYLKSVEENEDESYIKDVNADKKWFVKRYKTSEIEFIKDFAKKATVEKINNSPSIWEEANKGLEENIDSIKQLILKLGYSDVKFDEI